MCSLNVAKFVSLFTVLSARPIVCQPVTNAAFQQIYQLMCPHKCFHQIISLFICQRNSLPLTTRQHISQVHPLLNCSSSFLPVHRLVHKIISLLISASARTTTCQFTHSWHTPMNLSYERLAICPSVHHCLGNLLHEQHENMRRSTEQELTVHAHPCI